MRLKDKIIRLISTLLIISFIVPTVLLSSPKQADAQWYTFSISDFWNALTSVSGKVTATTNSAKLGLAVKAAAQEIYKQAKMAIARKVLQEITKSTINWINSGFHGSPLFLENPQSFFEDIAKSQIRTLVDIFGYDELKYPFGKAFAISIINTYKRQLEDNAAHTLSKAMADRTLERNYIDDFNVGGWNSFLINTQYPQNNYVGFQMIATEELASRVQGTAQSAAEKVQNTLQQGMGFLSPKMCPKDVNPDYNNGFNEFKRPVFNEADALKNNPYNPPACDSSTPAHVPDANGMCNALRAYDLAHQHRVDLLKEAWNKGNNCAKPDGTSALVSTTPGSVVANQIMTAMGSNTRQSELAAAVGNSLSAIFDALLNKFLKDGLNALASKVNPPPDNEDNWSFEGMTLGSGEGGDNVAWDMGPEAPIILEDFKKVVEDGIVNTTKEIQMMDEISNYLSQIWPEARKLDVCLPGPDLGWQDRLQNEVLRNSRKLQKLQGEDNSKKSEEADNALKELKFAVDFFRDWINNKMFTEIPSSVFYMEAIDNIKTMPQQATELADAKRLKTQALARLQAIKTALNTITIAPPGSAQERTLILIKKQYDGIITNVSSFASLSERQNELDIAKDQLINFKKVVPECEAERKAKGWGTPGGPTSSYSGTAAVSIGPNAGLLNGLAANSEQAVFCSLPIIGGYNHETFDHKNDQISSGGSSGLPGLPSLPGSGSSTHPGTITHPEIPLVNAKKILRYEITTIKSFLTSLPGNHTTAAYVNIQLSCNTIFNAKLLDYKGSLPGITSVIEISDTLPDDTDTAPTGTCTYEEGEDGIVPTPDTDITEEDCNLNEGSWTADEAGN